MAPTLAALQVLRADPSLCGRACREAGEAMSGRECNHGGSSGSSAGLALSCLCIGAAIWFFVAMLGQVFSWHGLLYSFGMADPTNLKYPVVVRVLTFTLITELGVLVSASLDWRDGMRFESALYSWLMAHATLVVRLVTLARWTAVGAFVLGRTLWVKMIAMSGPKAIAVGSSDLRPDPLVIDGEIAQSDESAAA